MAATTVRRLPRQGASSAAKRFAGIVLLPREHPLADSVVPRLNAWVAPLKPEVHRFEVQQAVISGLLQMRLAIPEGSSAPYVPASPQAQELQQAASQS